MMMSVALMASSALAGIQWSQEGQVGGSAAGGNFRGTHTLVEGDNVPLWTESLPHSQTVTIPPYYKSTGDYVVTAPVNHVAPSTIARYSCLPRAERCDIAVFVCKSCATGTTARKASVQQARPPTTSVSFVVPGLSGSSAGLGAPPTSGFVDGAQAVPLWMHSHRGSAQDFPEYYAHDQMYDIISAARGSVTAGTEVRHNCASSSLCDAAVFVCSTCGNADYTALFAHLEAEGYERSQCAPTVTFDGKQHATVAYVRTLAARQMYTFTFPQDTDFMFIGHRDGGATDCAQVHEEGPCGNTKGHCEWNTMSQKCELAKCAGPAPCAVCDALVAQGFQPTACAPTVQLDQDGEHHDTVAYVKTLQSGERFPLQLPATTHIFLGMNDRAGTDCAALRHQDECTATHGLCQWDAGVCRLADSCPAPMPDLCAGFHCDACNFCNPMHGFCDPKPNLCTGECHRRCNPSNGECLPKPDGTMCSGGRSCLAGECQ